jgi:hypothetical protein
MVAYLGRVSSAWVARWILDEDGDTWQSGDISMDGSTLMVNADAYEIGVINGNDSVRVYGATWAYLVCREVTNNVEGIFFVSGDGVIMGAATSHHAFIRTNNTDRMKFDTAGQVMINETLNANMTIGLTINQGANDNEILAFKSSDIGHGHTSWTETDTYASFLKRQSGAGGLRIYSMMENAAYDQAFALYVAGGQATTVKTTSAVGLIDFFATQHDGAGSLANIAADGNVFTIRIRRSGGSPCILLLDEDGDVYIDGTLRGFNDLRMEIEDSHDNDHEVSGVTADMTVGENVAFGDFLYMKSDGKLWKADADAAASGLICAMAAATISADASGEVLLHGFARDDTWAWTVGSRLYGSTTAGDVTHTAPSGSGDVVQCVGVACHADRIYFSPSMVLVEVA